MGLNRNTSGNPNTRLSGVADASWTGCLGIASMGLDLVQCLSLSFPLQVTSGSHNESSGPRLMPLLLIKMINKSREFHGEGPISLFQPGMGGFRGICMWKFGFGWGRMPLCCGSSWVMEYWGVMVGLLESALGHTVVLGLCGIKWGGGT